MWKSVAACIAAVTLLPRSLTGIVAFPLADGAALDELDDPEGTDGVVPVPPLVVVDVHPATSAAQTTAASGAANDFRTAEPFQ
jgi:hypothetical protein